MFTKTALISAVSIATIAVVASPASATPFDRRGPRPLERRSGYDNYDYGYDYDKYDDYSPYGGYGGYGGYSPYGGYGGYGGYSPYDGYSPYGGYGFDSYGFGGYGGFGFPFAASFNNQFDRKTNKANFDDKTVYTNDKHANKFSDKIHSKTDKDVIG